MKIKKLIAVNIEPIILRILSESPKTSTQIISLITNEFNIQLSPSTVFNKLYKLMISNEIEKNPKTRILSITDKGKKTLQDYIETIEQILVFLKDI